MTPGSPETRPNLDSSTIEKTVASTLDIAKYDTKQAARELAVEAGKVKEKALEAAARARDAALEAAGEKTSEYGAAHPEQAQFAENVVDVLDKAGNVGAEAMDVVGSAARGTKLMVETPVKYGARKVAKPLGVVGGFAAGATLVGVIAFQKVWGAAKWFNNIIGDPWGGFVKRMDPLNLRGEESKKTQGKK
ncbi:MAG: hypothetical protein Q8P30_03985 [Candidatus Uhrbacteria bacterium]|nr:hypothetical protein [Candidatus Uhrbacteria bacterium]